MPTASEYGPLQQPATSQLTDEQCAALKPLLDASPDLRAKLACPVPDIVPVLMDCEKIANQLNDAIYSNLNQCLSACETIGGECNACVQGKIQVVRDQIDAVADKCAKKVIGDLYRRLIDVAANMEVIGIPRPSEEQLSAVVAGQPIPPPPPPPIPPTPAEIDDIAAGMVTPIYQGPIDPLTGYPAAFPVTPQPGDTTTPPVAVPPPSRQCGPGEVLVGGANGVCVPNAQGNTPVPNICSFVQIPGIPQMLVESLTGVPADPPAVAGYTWCGASQWTDPLNPLHIAICFNRYPAGSEPTGCLPVIVPPPPPTPPPPPSGGTCPSCGAGYHWSTDSNGNPTCVKDCQCPPPPPPPPPPQETMPGGAGGGEPFGPDDPGPISCGPGDHTVFTDFIGGIDLGSDVDIDKACGSGLTVWASDFLKSIFTAGIAGGNVKFLDAISNSLSCFSGFMHKNVLKPWFPKSNCNQQKAIANTSTALIPRLIQKWFGVVPPQVLATIEQQGNYICQWAIPSVNALGEANVRGWLKDDDWEFGVKLSGYCLDWIKPVRDSMYTRVVPRDAYRLWKLDKLSDVNFERAWKESGIDYKRDENVWKDAMKQYPSFIEIMRMMIRDVEDSEVVKKLDLDNGFGDKFKDTLKQWAEAQGIDEQIAKYFWRAHWNMYSPTQVFDWLHRLREDDRDPGAQFANLKVTQDDARNLLKIADYAPGLVDNYLAVSYRPLNRVDIRRMYRVGVLKDKTAIRRAYRDLGYDAKNAERQADFVVKSEAGAKAKLDGFMQEAEILRLYLDGVLGKDQATRLMVDAGVPTDSIGQKLETADIRRNANYTRKVRNALQRRYFMGEFTSAEVRGQLEAAGIDREFTGTIANQWEEERKARNKHIAVDKLCKMFERGLIQMDDYMRRVRNLNYPEADALLLIENCVTGIKERQFTALTREAERQKKELERQKKEAARLKRELAPCRLVKPVCKNGTGK